MATIRELVPLSNTHLSGVSITNTKAAYLGNSVAGTTGDNRCVVTGNNKTIDELRINTPYFGTGTPTIFNGTGTDLNRLVGATIDNNISGKAAILSGTTAGISVEGNLVAGGNIALSGNLQLAAGTRVTNNLHPNSTSNNLSLGNSTNKWYNLYLSNNAVIDGNITANIITANYSRAQTGFVCVEPNLSWRGNPCTAFRTTYSSSHGNNDVYTKSALVNLFEKSGGTNGALNLGPSGLKLQYGRATLSSGADSFDFPTPFSSSVYVIVGTSVDIDSRTNLGISSFTNSTVYTDCLYAGNYHWIAIGV